MKSQHNFIPQHSSFVHQKIMTIITVSLWTCLVNKLLKWLNCVLQNNIYIYRSGKPQICNPIKTALIHQFRNTDLYIEYIYYILIRIRCQNGKPKTARTHLMRSRSLSPPSGLEYFSVQFYILLYNFHSHVWIKRVLKTKERLTKPTEIFNKVPQLTCKVTFTVSPQRSNPCWNSTYSRPCLLNLIIPTDPLCWSHKLCQLSSGLGLFSVSVSL